MSAQASKRALVIDDAATVRAEVVRCLSTAGFDVSTAPDGVRGIEALRADRSFDLVILDVNMPGLSGLAVLDWLGQTYKDSLPRVLMMTTEVTPSLIKKAKSAGACGWLVKPFNPERLLALAHGLP